VTVKRKLIIKSTSGDHKDWRVDWDGPADGPDPDSDFIIEGIFDYEEVDARSFVSVEVNDAVWTYIDPWGDLRVGETVAVPFGYHDLPVLGRVVGHGHGAWNGPFKTVSDRVSITARHITADKL
jgi:hypothetical protein